MSAEWPAVTIDQVCVLIVDCVNKTAPVVDGPTPYRMIRTTNIRNGRIDRNECRYVDETTYANIDSTLTDALVLYLAVRVVVRLTNQSSDKERLFAQWRDWLETAKRIDGEEQSNVQFEDDTWVSLRG